MCVCIPTTLHYKCCRDLSHARSMSFPEKKSYNPHINIEYIDDKGRELTPKEVSYLAAVNSVMHTRKYYTIQ